MDIAQLWFKHNKIIKIVGGSVAGLILIVIIYSAIVGRTVPKLPDPAVNSTQAVQVWANPNMAQVPVAQRKEFTRKFCDYYSRKENRGQLVDTINSMTDRQIYTFQKNISNIAVEMAVDQATEYSAISDPNKRTQFLEQRYKEWKQLEKAFKSPTASTVAGPDGQGGKAGDKKTSLASSKLSKGLPSTPTEIQGRYLQETNPAQRAKLETFAADMDSYAKQAHDKRKLQAEAQKKQKAAK